MYICFQTDGGKFFRKKLEGLEGDLLLKGRVTMKRIGPQHSGYRLKIYVYKKEKYIGTYKGLTHHHSIPEKEKNQSKKNFEIACKIFNTSDNDELLVSAKLVQWQVQVFVCFFYEGLEV